MAFQTRFILEDLKYNIIEIVSLDNVLVQPSKMELLIDIFTFVAVEHDWREQEVCLFCDIFVCFKNICEIDSGSSVWVPCKSKSTTDKWLISIKSYESSIWLDIKGSVPEWHDVIDFQISLWTIIWFSYKGFISRSLAPLTVSHGHKWSRVAI